MLERLVLAWTADAGIGIEMLAEGAGGWGMAGMAGTGMALRRLGDGSQLGLGLALRWLALALLLRRLVGIGMVGGWLGWLGLGMALKCLEMQLVLLRWIGLAGVIVVCACMCS